ncbi:hypothetical protein BCD67_04190 [Oscillatoriales cyanobacterium USR001]|nr:hypothetical protein BCD67_04190 [Oscillatoriales cyanobacterium USR001]
MSHAKRLPNSLRYLAARLRAWTRPTILVPTVILCSGGLLLWEVSVNPESISIDEKEEVADSYYTDENTTISSEDSVIAAEIDTVPLLRNQLNNSSRSKRLFNSPVLRTKGLFDEVRDRPIESTQPSPTPNTSTKIQETLPSLEIPTIPLSFNNNLLNSNSSTSTARGINLADSTYSTSLNSPFNPNSPNTQNLRFNPLQAAIEQDHKESSQPETTAKATSSCSTFSALCPLSSTSNSANYPLTTNNAQALSNNQPQIASPPTTSSELLPGLTPNIANTVLTSQSNNPAQNNQLNNPVQNNQPNNPYQTNLSGAGLVPEIPPVTPTAPASATFPNNSGQSSFPSPIQATKVIDSRSPNAGNLGITTVSPDGSNFGVPAYSQVNQTLPQTEPATTSVPEPLPLPGRYIGEGKIRTFANP